MDQLFWRCQALGSAILVFVLQAKFPYDLGTCETSK